MTAKEWLRCLEEKLEDAEHWAEQDALWSLPKLSIDVFCVMGVYPFFIA
jgi:hypothetical protein